MQQGLRQTIGEGRVSKLGAMISGIGRYSLACTVTNLAGIVMTLVLNPAIAVPADKYRGRTVLLNLSLRVHRRWHMLSLRVSLERIDGATLGVRLQSPFAADMVTAMQDILGGHPHSTNSTAVGTPTVKVDTPAPASVPVSVRARAKPVVPTKSAEQACRDAASHMGVKWQQDILNRVGEKLDLRKSSDKIPQMRRQVRDDLAGLTRAHDSIIAEFRLKLEDAVAEVFDPMLRISSNESSVDRTLNLMNTARLEDMMSFVDVIRDIETVTHPKMIKLGHCLTRLLYKDINDENNPLRAERLCEIALSTILDNWSGGQTNRTIINDALRESAPSLAAIYATLTEVLSPHSVNSARAVAN